MYVPLSLETTSSSQPLTSDYSIHVKDVRKEGL